MSSHPHQTAEIFPDVTVGFNSLFDVRLIWMPDFCDQLGGLWFGLRLPFLPQVKMAIELRESFGGHPATLPYITGVKWNVEKNRFECSVGIRWDAGDRQIHRTLLKHGWTELG